MQCPLGIGPGILELVAEESRRAIAHNRSLHANARTMARMTDELFLFKTPDERLAALSDRAACGYANFKLSSSSCHVSRGCDALRCRCDGTLPFAAVFPIRKTRGCKGLGESARVPAKTAKTVKTARTAPPDDKAVGLSNIRAP